MTEMTKKVLGDSLKKLMMTKPINKITVQQIVDDCKLNRRTFYYHFQDIYKLLEYIYEEEAIIQLQTHGNYDTWQESFLNIFFYIQNNKEICLSTFHSLGREHLESFLHSVTYNLIQKVVNNVAGDMRVDDKHKNFLANYYTVTFGGLLIQWMNNDMKEKPEEIIEDLSITVQGSMLNALKQYELTLNS